CKGCKSDCPVNVDMATYKAEFLAHHYAGRLRPRPAYSMGLIMYWARLARLAPEVVNALLHTPPLANAARWLAGATQDRPSPRFAPASFQSWFRDRPPPQTPTPRGRVVLWPDTFNNHFFPEVARAATEVLEGLGYEVDVPRGFVCCGRPLYDYGMLTTAKRRL